MPRRLCGVSAAEIMLAAGVGPVDAYPGVSRPWRCRCLRCGREVSPRLDNVRYGSAACRFCVRQAVDPVEAVARMRSVGLEPLEAYPGSAFPWLCRCTRCDAHVSPRFRDIRKGGGCGSCWRISVGRLPAPKRAT